MTLAPAKRHATYQDVLDAPEGMRAELIGTDLYLQPRPRGSHQHAAGELYAGLRDPAQRALAADWVVLPEVELRIPQTLVPDLCAWRRARFVEPPDSACFTVVPDWVCEVLSPGTHHYDRGLKAEQYRDRGVGALWLVDPAERLVEVLVAEQTRWQLVGVYGPHDVRALVPFEVVLDLARLWF